jgi:hypothetical protein
MILLQTLRNLHLSSVPLGQQEASEYNNAVPTPFYIPLESGIMEGYKRLEKITLPQGYLKIPLFP